MNFFAQAFLRRRRAVAAHLAARSFFARRRQILPGLARRFAGFAQSCLAGGKRVGGGALRCRSLRQGLRQGLAFDGDRGGSRRQPGDLGVDRGLAVGQHLPLRQRALTTALPGPALGGDCCDTLAPRLHFLRQASERRLRFAFMTACGGGLGASAVEPGSRQRRIWHRCQIALGFGRLRRDFRKVGGELFGGVAERGESGFGAERAAGELGLVGAACRQGCFGLPQTRGGFALGGGACLRLRHRCRSRRFVLAELRFLRWRFRR